MKGSFLSFEAARVFVWKLKLKSQKEWKEWSKSGMRPPNIPSCPDRTYGDEFTNWPDWLGYKRRQALPGSMHPFTAARAFVRKLKLRSEKEWQEWSKSGMRPPSIPGNPHDTYGDEFTSFPDFLGYAPKRGASGGSRSSSSSRSSSTASTGQKSKKSIKREKRKHSPTSTTAPNTPSASIPQPSIKVKVEKTVKEEDIDNDDDSHHDQSRKRTRR